MSRYCNIQLRIIFYRSQRPWISLFARKDDTLHLEHTIIKINSILVSLNLVYKREFSLCISILFPLTN
jgi:hypothetical protein